MKIKIQLVTMVMVLSSPLAFGGFIQPAPVIVDDVAMTANGNMVSARFADNDVEFIGCGVRYIDDGLGGTFVFGFCQAADSANVNAFCFTESDVLLDAIHSIADFSFIAFAWNAAGECTRIGNSTQSFYLPEILGADFTNHTHKYLTGKGMGHNNTKAITSVANEGE